MFIRFQFWMNAIIGLTSLVLFLLTGAVFFLGPPLFCFFVVGRLWDRRKGDQETVDKQQKLFVGLLCIGLALACTRSNAAEHYFSVSEAVPGSLANLGMGGVTGGLSASGQAWFGNTVISPEGHVAFCWLEGGGDDASVVVGRKLKDGHWERLKLPASAHDLLGKVGKLVTVRMGYVGMGPKVVIDASGNVLVIVLDHGLNLQTYVWPFDASAPSKLSRLNTLSTVEVCHTQQLVQSVFDYDVYQFDKETYLLGNPMPGFNQVTIMRFTGTDWKPFHAFTSCAGTMTMDPVTKQLYFVGIDYKQAEGSNTASPRYPRVFARSLTEDKWTELLNTTVDSPKEQYGVTSYVGADSSQPAIVANDGAVTCFWYQLDARGMEGGGVQGATYHYGQPQGAVSCLTSRDDQPTVPASQLQETGQWQSCCEPWDAGVFVGRIKASFGPRGDLPSAGKGKIAAFVLDDGEIAVFSGKGTARFLLDHGTVYPADWQAESAELPNPEVAIASGNNVESFAGNNPMSMQLCAVTKAPEGLVFQATLVHDTHDVFVYRLKQH